MEATLCLRPPHAPLENLHCLLTLHGRTPTLPRHRRSLQGVGLTSSTFTDCALRAGLNRGSYLLVRANMPPPQDDSGNGRASGQKKPAGVGAAVVLASFLGVMYSYLKRGWFTHTVTLGWPMGRPSTPTAASSLPSPARGPSDQGPSDRTIMDKSLDVLSEIFERKAGAGIKKLPTLLELLGEQLELDEAKLNKDYPNLLEMSDKGGKAAHLLYKEWNKEVNYEKKYELGLLLIDVFINQEDYGKANQICSQMENEDLPPPSDVRYQLHKAILNVMLAVETVSKGLDGPKQNDIKHLKEMIDEVVLMLIELRNQTDVTSPPFTEEGSFS